jgi:hypothetical protein
VVEAVTDVGHGSDHFSQLVEIHAAAQWPWPALVSQAVRRPTLFRPAIKPSDLNQRGLRIASAYSDYWLSEYILCLSLTSLS